MTHLATLIGDWGSVVPLPSAWQSSAAALLTSIWQAAVIGCGLEIATRLMPRISAAHRFALWAAGFVMAAGLPCMPLLLSLGSRGSGAEGASTSAVGATPLVQLDARWAAAIAALWLGAAAWRAASLALHSLRLRRMWKKAQPVEVSAEMLTALEGLRGGRVQICTTEMLDRPAVIGFLAPRILIPGWLKLRLTDRELEQIVLHETQHLRRGDDWTNLLQKLVLVLFPLNPALIWMERRLCREREMACDEGVVRITHAPRAYAACLASLAERGLERRAEALSLGAWHRRPELVQRVHGILWGKRILSKGASIALVGTLACALIGGSLEMARCPQVVAFVPERKALAMTPERQREMSEMLARESAEQKLSMPQGFRAVTAKAVVREAVKPTKSLSHGQLRKPATANVGSVDGVQADVAGDRVNSVRAEQWVVLAEYEEVQTLKPAFGQTISDFEASASATDGAGQSPLTENSDTATQGSSASPVRDRALQGDQRIGRTTVTRLIFRVVPADSKGTAIGLVHSWFVIQL